jgi:hypothetical protein
MSFYSDASLALIPSGYKNGKVYSALPTDGSGDMSFTRASNATRVASNGLIEKVRTNLALYSQDWTNWTLFQATVTANTTANPLDGAVNADTLTISTATTGVSYRSVSTGTAITTFSAYLKSGTHDQAQIGFTDGTDFAVNVDLTLGTITGVTSGITGTITSVGSGWYRVTATRTISTTSTPNAFVNVIVGTVGDSVIVFGAQVELGDIATDYIPTTTTAVSVGPVSGLPRLDYLNSSCPRLLLEPQRTNLLAYSEQFDNAYWELGSAATITANTIVGPDGTLSADTLTANGTGSLFVRKNVYMGTAQTCSNSIFAKKANHSLVGLRNSGTTSAHDVFNFDTKTWTNNSGATLSYDELSNGWFRLKSTNTDAVNLNYYWSVIPAVNTSGLENTTASNLSVYIWGGQAEQNASYATSYIPTLGTSVTRVEDAASKTGISSLIGQTEGTLFAEFNARSLSETRRVLYTYADGNNFIMLTLQSTNVLRFLVFAGGAIQADFTTPIVNGNVKMAGAYKANDFVFYVNGVQRGTDTSGTVPATSSVYVGYDVGGTLQLADGISQALVFKTRLTNAQLAELTA